MRILYVTRHFPFGQGEAFFIPEVKRMLKIGHEVMIVPRSPNAPLLHTDAGDLLEATAARPLISRDSLKVFGSHLRRTPHAVLRHLARMLRARRPWTVLENLAVLPKAVWLAQEAISWKADHIHAQWAGATATMAMVAGAMAGLSWSFTAHRGDIILNNLMAAKLESASFIRFISESGVALAAPFGVERHLDKVHVIHLGVEIPAQPTRPPNPQAASAIVCPANLLPVKGHRYLFEAVARLQDRGVDCSLHILGEGPLDADLRRRARQLRIAHRVVFRGHVPHADLLGQYRARAYGVLVLPSIDLGHGVHEGIPVSLIEAMAHGIPTVSTATGGIPELLRGGAGRMVPPGNAAALADAIEPFLTNRTLAERVAEAGRRRVLEQFAVEKAVDEVCRLMTGAGTRAKAA